MPGLKLDIQKTLGLRSQTQFSSESQHLFNIQSPGSEISSLLKDLIYGAFLSFATPWMVTRQVPLSMEFSKQEYWSGLPYPSCKELDMMKSLNNNKPVKYIRREIQRTRRPSSCFQDLKTPAADF